MAPSAALLIHCAALLLTLAAGCADAHDVGAVSQDDPSASGSGERTSSTAAESDDAAVFAGLAQPALAIQETFQFPEGPVWDEKSSTLFFTDISGDAIYRLQLPDALELVLRPAGQPDGLALAPDGSLYVAGFGARNVWRLHEGERQLIAERYEGKRFNSPDDVIVRSDGVAYFTDPTFGIDGTVGLPRQDRELDFEGLFRIDADGQLHLEDQTIPGPNGVRLAPDERTLYVSSTSRGEIYAYQVQPDGALTQKRTWGSMLLAADSFCLDAHGNVYVATLFGIAIMSPNAERLGTIAVSGLASNVAFGGPDRRTLFITTRGFSAAAAGSGRLYKIESMPVAGLAPAAAAP